LRDEGGVKRDERDGGNRGLVVVTGCYAEIAPREIGNIPGVDVVVGQKEKDNLVDTILENIIGAFSEISIIPRLRTRAFLKIQDGCNNFCSYCIVPLARGRERSRSYTDVVAEAQGLIRSGVEEIVLTGVHLGKYKDDGNGLTDLVRDISQIQGLGRIRLSSLEPEEVTSELVSLIRESGKVCRHLHIPLQSGDDEVLLAMRRNYTRDDFVSLISDIKKEIPDIAITTDIMVGFPGETDEEFNRTKDVCKELEFAKLHVFKYSRRPGTAAAEFENQVPEDVKCERSQILLDLAEKLAEKFRKRFIGQKMDVLVETKANGKLTGLTDNYIRVYFDGPEDLIGQLVSVKVR
jgi:threonylcarbamoyladenosine tRNA methylthiotransferase MtaB